MPENYQVILLKETQFANLNVASCLLCSFILIIIFSVWFNISKLVEEKQIKLNVNLNEKIVYLNIKIKELEVNNQALENDLENIESKLNLNESQLLQTKSELTESKEKTLNLIKSNEKANSEIQNLISNQLNLTSQLVESKKQFDELNQKYIEHLQFSNEKLNKTEQNLENTEKILNEKSNENESLKISNQKLAQEILFYQKSLLKQNNINDDQTASSADYATTIAQLNNQIIELETRLNEMNKLYDVKSNECFSLVFKLNEKDVSIQNLESKNKNLESALKENEIQIKILNDLRDRETKQHLKVLGDLDSQLKRKSTESDKITHMYDQIRIKQERIQELETQLTRTEKQSNQERQTFEKQAHENWLNARKFEKELKESKIELGTLKERFNEIVNELNILKQKNCEQGLQIDTSNNLQESRPSSATSSSSGINSGIGGPVGMPIPMPFGFIRSPYRYPFPNEMTSPRMPFNFVSPQQQQQIILHAAMQQQSKSANSSQMPSPGSSETLQMSHSNSFPNSASLMNGIFKNLIILNFFLNFYNDFLIFKGQAGNS